MMPTAEPDNLRYQGNIFDRWEIGHRHFFVQIQNIILAIKDYEHEPSREKIRTIADLFLGSAAMMQFCADFGDSDYTPVRESMAAIDKDFSGIFSADHRLMITELKKLKKSLPDWDRAHCELKDAIHVVYAAHAFVCKSFVGDSGSLANNKTPGHITLMTKFLPQRLRSIGAAGADGKGR